MSSETVKMRSAVAYVQILIYAILHLGSSGLTVNAACPDEFECRDNGECIELSWVCDGDSDCDDMSDEHSCVSGTCGRERFQCHSGQCIHVDLVCDGQYNCEDMSDENEQNCVSGTCRPDRFKCPSGQCIPRNWLCDGDDDCGDMSDEHNCEKTTACTSGFSCRNSGRCLELSWVCDGDDDCGDMSDEQSCDFRAQYIGCFKDSGDDRAMDAGYMGKDVNLTRCRSHCSGVKSTFFAAEASNWCHCADQYDKHGALRDSKCSWPCANANYQKCGGNFALSVYWVCPIGYYGRNCTNRCSAHCKTDVKLGAGCYMDGRCPGGCETGWTSASCNTDAATGDAEQSSTNTSATAVTVTVILCCLTAVLLIIMFHKRGRLIRWLRSTTTAVAVTPRGAPGTAETGGTRAGNNDRPTPLNYEMITEHVLKVDATSNEVKESRYLQLIQSRENFDEDTYEEVE